MPWQLTLYENRAAARIAGGGIVRPGSIWPMDLDEIPGLSKSLSLRYYREHSATRAPLFVVMPDGSTFCVDSMAWTPERGHYGEGWTVTGTPPNLTLTPSINLTGRYHGYIRDGVITDDVEGRTFPSE